MQTDTSTPQSSPTTRRPSASGRRAVRPAAAALAVTAVLVGASTAAASGWVPIFATRTVTPVPFAPADLEALRDLAAYGELDVTGGLEPRAVRDAAAATAATGLAVPRVRNLPRGVTGTPVHHVIGEVSATFTVSGSHTEEIAGAQLRLDAGPAVAAIWSRPNGIPTLVVARAVAPTASASGASFESIRDHLLGIPGVPAGLVDDLRSFDPSGATLPLPVPRQDVTTSDIELDGDPATLLVSDDGTFAAVIRVQDGIATLVAGSVSADELVNVARELR